MIRNFELAGLKVLKCKNKTSNEALKELQYHANDIIFQHLKKPISRASKEYVFNALQDIGIKISKLDLPNNVEPKREEILDQLRTMLRALKNEQLQHTAFDEQKIKESVQKYALSQYLKQKDIGYDAETIIKHLRANKELIDEYQIEDEHLVFSFVKAQNELLQMLYNSYSIGRNEE